MTPDEYTGKDLLDALAAARAESTRASIAVLRAHMAKMTLDASILAARILESDTPAVPWALTDDDRALLSRLRLSGD